MKNLTIIITILFMTVTNGLMAQNLNSAGKAYNKAIELAQEGQIQKAIESYAKCADICAQLGEVGEGLKLQAETKICNLNLNMGIENIMAKSYDAAIVMFTEAAKYADIINDASIAQNVNTYFANAYTGKGNDFYEKSKYKAAIENYNEAIEYNASYADAYYGLTLTSIKMEDEGLLEESLKKFIKFSTDQNQVNKAKLAAANYFLQLSEDAIQEENYRIASSMASKSTIYYNANPTAYYYLALSFNKQENWAAANKAAKKGTTLGQEDKSSLFFELGRSYEGLGNNEKACEAFGNVTDGPNKQLAIYQRTQVLKCE